MCKTYLDPDKFLFENHGGEKLINWFLNNLTEEDFIQNSIPICDTCDTDGSFRDSYAVYISFDDERWEPWMSEYDSEMVAVYLCKKCGAWIVDADFTCT